MLDPFAGSGTTLIACQRRKRRACLIELESPGRRRWCRGRAVGVSRDSPDAVKALHIEQIVSNQGVTAPHAWLGPRPLAPAPSRPS